MKEQFNIETITIKVLTQGKPHLQDPTLGDIEHDYMFGDSVLLSTDSESQSVSKEEMANLLYKAGSEPSFFGLENEE